MTAAIRAVYFDIGETLLDRTREYAAWAAALGVPAHTFSAVFGAVIADGGSVQDVIARFSTADGQPENFEKRRAEMHQAGAIPALAEADLYQDVRESLADLQRLGLFVGIAGNQPAGIVEQLVALELPADDVASSAEWGVAKPQPQFFARLATTAGAEPAEVVYVGDQIGNDVLPAVGAGLQAVRIRRGPWGHLVRDPSAEDRCLAVIKSLSELSPLLAPLMRR